MTLQLILLVLSLLAGIVAAAENIWWPHEPDPEIRSRKRNLGLAAIGVLAVTLAVQGWQFWKTDDDARSLRAHLDNIYSWVPEASGGIAIGDVAYLVDDDLPTLFRAEYDSKGKRYYPPEVVTLYAGSADCSGKGLRHALTRKNVDDLEAAAYHRSKVYLSTSHSNTKTAEEEKLRRQRFLEVELVPCGSQQIGIVRRWANLRKALEGALFSGIATRFADRLDWESHQEKKTVMEVEGLAIDDDAYVYLGLRGPQAADTGRALLLVSKLEDIFAPTGDWTPQFSGSALLGARAAQATFDVRELDVGGTRDEPVGIVDLAYENRNIYLLTNSAFAGPRRNGGPGAKLWELPLKDLNSNRPPRLIGATFYKAPPNILSKPEVLLLPSDGSARDKVVMFLDARGFGGGERVYDRADFGLTRR